MYNFCLQCNTCTLRSFLLLIARRTLRAFTNLEWSEYFDDSGPFSDRPGSENKSPGRLLGRASAKRKSVHQLTSSPAPRRATPRPHKATATCHCHGRPSTYDSSPHHLHHLLANKKTAARAKLQSTHANYKTPSTLAIYRWIGLLTQSRQSRRLTGFDSCQRATQPQRSVLDHSNRRNN